MVFVMVETLAVLLVKNSSFIATDRLAGCD